MRHADADILQLLEQTVPPADVTRVGIFAQPLAQYSKEVGSMAWFVKQPFLATLLGSSVLLQKHQQVEKQTHMRAEQLFVRIICVWAVADRS